MNQPRTTAETRRTHEMSLAMWLQNGRAAKGMSLDDVARVTKIQPRILERLEAGKLDGLPAEVFVRGFVRSFARCVGLDENEALKRYSACAPRQTTGTNAARAMVEAMGDLAPKTRGHAPKTLEAPPEILPQGSLEMPVAAPTDAVVEPEIFAEASDVISVPIEKVELEPDLEVEIVYEADPAPPADVVIAPPPAIDLSADPVVEEKKSKRKRAAGTAPKRTRRKAVGTPSEATPVVSEAAPEIAKPKRTRKKKSTEAPPAEIVAAPAEAPVVEMSAETPVVEVPVEIPIDLDGLSPGLAASTAARVRRDEAWVSDLWASEMALPAPSAEDTTEPPARFDDVPEAATTRFERFEDSEIAAAPSEDLSSDTAGSWIPTMPAVTTTAPAPWRRPNYAAAPALVAVIDDADPESAERALEDRRSNRESRRTFLPPILLDREGDRSARQGGLTLAVIILLIAATLTLSYLMRRPSASGDGVTRADTAETLDPQA